KGFTEEGLSKLQCESPTAKRWTTKIIFSISQIWGTILASIDIKTAYLQSQVPEAKQDKNDIYVEPPRGDSPIQPDEIFKMARHKHLYGMKRAGRKWCETLRDALIEDEWIADSVDPCLFWKTLTDENGKRVVISFHVDDMVFTGREIFLNSIKNGLDGKFQVGTFDAIPGNNRENMSGMAKVNSFKFLGAVVSRIQKTLYVSQAHYHKNFSEMATPTELNEEDLLPRALQSAARSSLGQLLWIAIFTRPDILFETIEIATCV
ncbi:unnamed protein product, partial [Amoebophrya sp. A120]